METTRYTVGPLWQVLLADLGLRETDVLRRAGLPDGFFTGPNGRLGPNEFYDFWRAMEAESGAEDCAIRFNECLPTDVFTPPVFAAMCSRNLMMAVRRLSRYKALLAPVEIRVIEDEDTVSFTPVWHGSEAHPPESLVRADLLFILRLGRAGTRRPMSALAAWTETLTDPSPSFSAVIAVSTVWCRVPATVTPVQLTKERSASWRTSAGISSNREFRT